MTEEVEDTKEREFKPLPSDIINSPGFWPEWELNDKMKVVKKDEGK